MSKPDFSNRIPDNPQTAFSSLFGQSERPAEKPSSLFQLLPDSSPVDTEADDNFQVVELRLDLLDSFHNHPFRLYSGEQLEALAQSILQSGILSPIVVRPKHNGGWEVLAGHNRRDAAKLAGLETAPCVIRDVNDDEAILICTSSNLEQRETLLPSEKAHAYKLRLEAIKRQGERENSTCRHHVDKLKSADIIGDEFGKSGRQVQRYIKLTCLIQTLLECVDNGTVSINTGYHLAALDDDEQEIVHQYFIVERKAPLDERTAKLLKQRHEEVPLDHDEVQRLVAKKSGAKTAAKKITIPYKKLSAYIPPDKSKKEIQNYIIQAVEFYQEHHNQD